MTAKNTIFDVTSKPAILGGAGPPAGRWGGGGEPHPHVFLFDLAMAQQVDEHRPDAHDDDEGENTISGHFTAFLTGLTRATARASEARSR